MKRKIKIESFDVKSDKLNALLLESAKNIKGSNEVYLLSFHDDGLVWGKVKGDELITSESLNDSRFPKFRPETMQECRLFGEEGEILIWRDEANQFKGRLAEENYLKDFEPFEEKQVLWGRGIAKKGSPKIAKDGEELWQTEDFTVVSDGEEGLLHAFPEKIEKDRFLIKKSKNGKGVAENDKTDKEPRQRPLRLRVKHYLEYEEDGCAYVSLSRLVKVEVE